MYAILAIGSNKGDKEQNMQNAICLIENSIGKVLSKSSFISTKPVYHPKYKGKLQEDFLNCVIEVKTDLPPRKQLERIQRIESELGRVRKSPYWEAREIDIDIIAVDKVVLWRKDLKLPHPLMHKRSFVLEPLAEIKPKWTHPIFKRDIKELLQMLPK